MELKDIRLKAAGAVSWDAMLLSDDLSYIRLIVLQGFNSRHSIDHINKYIFFFS